MQEFLEAGHMSAACDVYSFGVLMLVVLTGWAVYEDAEHVRDRVEDVLKDATADPSLLEHCFAASSCDWSFAGGVTMLQQLLEVGLQCCNPRKAKRPALALAAQQLRDALAALQAALVRECLICMSAPRATVLNPCRHAVACAECSPAYCGVGAPCAVCRVPIESVQLVAEPILSTFVMRR